MTNPCTSSRSEPSASELLRIQHEVLASTRVLNTLNRVQPGWSVGGRTCVVCPWAREHGVRHMFLREPVPIHERPRTKFAGTNVLQHVFAMQLVLHKIKGAISRACSVAGRVLPPADANVLFQYLSSVACSALHMTAACSACHMLLGAMGQTSCPWIAGGRVTSTKTAGAGGMSSAVHLCALRTGPSSLRHSRNTL